MGYGHGTVAPLGCGLGPSGPFGYEQKPKAKIPQSLAEQGDPKAKRPHIIHSCKNRAFYEYFPCNL